MTRVCEPYLSGNEINYVNDCLISNDISSQGRYVSLFESRWTSYCKQKYGVATTSGTTALHLALAALDIGPGDEVIVPTFTMAATAFAVKYVGATPIFVDCYSDTFNMDITQVQHKITSRTKAIIPVHMYGHPCDMDALVSLCKQRSLLLIEDAAEAHGAIYKEQPTGSFGDIACFSFYANKIITTGEGGMCITSDTALAERMRSLKNLAHSKNIRFWHDEIGYNFRMTNIQAALGLAQLEKIDYYIKRRRDNAEIYNSVLKGLVQTPAEWTYAKRVYWMYTILLDKSINRTDFIEALKKEDIETRTLFIPMTNLPMFRTKEHFPVAEDISERGLYLPSGSGLAPQEVQRIAYVVRDILESHYMEMVR